MSDEASASARIAAESARGEAPLVPMMSARGEAEAPAPIASARAEAIASARAEAPVASARGEAPASSEAPLASSRAEAAAVPDAAPVASARGEAPAPIASARGDAPAPVASARGEAPAPIASARGDAPAPIASARGEAPVASARGEAPAPIGSARGEAPIASARGEAPIASARGEAPVASARGFGDAAGTSGQLFGGFGAPAASPSQAAEAAGGDPEVAPEEESTAQFAPLVKLQEITVTTGEEGDDTLYVQRAALYRFDAAATEWKERGKGDVKLLQDKETKKVRILLRQEKTLKCCMNHIVHPDIVLKPNAGSDRSWTWRTKDYAGNVPEDQTFAIRFKDAETANTFRDKWDEVRKLNA